jgi:hypothetical protein
MQYKVFDRRTGLRISAAAGDVPLGTPHEQIPSVAPRLAAGSALVPAA